jgi:magnesium transporter
MSLQDEAQSEALTPEELRSVWPILSRDERAESLLLVDRAFAEDFFFGLSARDQADVILELPPSQRRSWMRLLAPDDAADVTQEAPEDQREGLMALLDDSTRREVQALLAYAEDDAGGLMNPRFARVRPEMSVDEAISYLRKQTRDRAETVSYVYALDEQQRLLGVVSFRDVLTSSAGKHVREIMQTDVVSVLEDTDQEAVGRIFAEHDLVAIPVVDAQGRMKGIVTVDDIVDVVQEEATEDMQKVGGTAALGAPYLEVGVLRMIRKRAGWLAALFLGEMLTATAMGHFEAEIARAVVLALFIPLIISSGGNSGSQASTLVIRAMALGEVSLRDWWRVVRTEVLAGLGLGGILGAIGFTRIMLWQTLFHRYGPHYIAIALTVAFSLIGVVMWGTIAGSMLPFLLRRLGFDPASASAPFVATLVDVSGLIIYFTVASIMLSGSLL